MPTMKEAISRSREGLVPLPHPESTDSKGTVNSSESAQLLQNPFQTCPLPQLNTASDNLRGFNIGGKVPQFRVLPPPPVEATSKTTTITAVSATASTSSSGGSTTSPTISNASVSTTVLAPSGIWTGTVQMSKGFQIQSVNANSFARVELYGSKQAQTLDQSRPVSQAPMNTTQGLIMDVVLLSSLSWKVLDCVGYNMDNPAANTIYVSVTNVSTASKAFTVTITYVQLES